MAEKLNKKISKKVAIRQGYHTSVRRIIDDTLKQIYDDYKEEHFETLLSSNKLLNSFVEKINNIQTRLLHTYIIKDKSTMEIYMTYF